MNFLNLLANQGNKTLIINKTQSYSGLDLLEKVKAYQRVFSLQNMTRIGFCLDNGPDWLAIDLATKQLDLCAIPIPTYFSVQQVKHIVKEAGIELLISEKPYPFLDAFKITTCNSLYYYYLNEGKSTLLPVGTHKITFTSGSTGSPKGVCLSNKNQITVAKALAERVNLKKPKHLVILPLAILLENIAGVYCPLLCDGEIILPTQAELGFNGCTLSSVDNLLATISYYQPNSFIAVPELVKVLVNAIQQGWQLPSSLKFIAVGGSQIDDNLLALAHNLGLPVYQGYGLSEASSVVCLNTPKHNSLKSIGQPLNHVSTKLINGQLYIKGNCHQGYLNQPQSWYQDEFATGDLFDKVNDELCFKGRISNVLVNSVGRNISPEWLENKLIRTGLFNKVLVIGDRQAYCVAIVSTVTGKDSIKTLQAHIDKINRDLPEYAHIKKWLICDRLISNEAFWTSHQSPKRKEIEAYYTPFLFPSTQAEELYHAQVS